MDSSRRCTGRSRGRSGTRATSAASSTASCSPRSPPRSTRRARRLLLLRHRQRGRLAGRKWSMSGGGVTFLVGAALNGAARDVPMLILGRVLLGVGVGFDNRSVPVYLSEMAPARLRGILNIGFQLMITVGILCANLTNYGTSKINGGWGWRVNLTRRRSRGRGARSASEFFPLEIRSARQSINVSVSMLFTFGYTEAFLPMLCRLKFMLSSFAA
ncbi:hypothetical protein ACP70R_032188 [Stipagrostis hirtigluma subsp. patula]